VGKIFSIKLLGQQAEECDVSVLKLRRFATE
jgi:hypothetical protein